jgi:glutamine amidotransferase
MCRLEGYIGSPILLEQLIAKPEHSLIVQSYQPREMTAGLLNADGFGVGWYHAQRDDRPFCYRNTLPIWSDVNLTSLGRYVESPCILAYVRSATPPLAVDLSNCQPFSSDRLLFIHNGFINHFHQTLYRPIRRQLCDAVYSQIHGTTDSEHLFALVLDTLARSPHLSLLEVLAQTLSTLYSLARQLPVYFSANIILSDGKQLVASRYANRSPVPSLYWLDSQREEAQGVIIASEPLFAGNWNSIPENTLIHVGADRVVHCHPFRPSDRPESEVLSSANPELV